jgi:hypothetical protein
MEKKLAKITLAILVCAFLPAVSNGQLITIGIEATVKYVTDTDHLLEGKVTVGSTITGTYTYDTSTPDSEPSTSQGAYWHYSALCGISLNVSGFSFKTDPTNVNFLVDILNDDGINPADGYLLRSSNNLPLSNGVLVDYIFWQLDDPTGTALSSDALPTTAPNLANWNSDYGLSIYSWGDNEFLLRADVISATVVPEPTTLLLAAAGLLLLRKPKS